MQSTMAADDTILELHAEEHDFKFIGEPDKNADGELLTPDTIGSLMLFGVPKKDLNENNSSEEVEKVEETEEDEEVAETEAGEKTEEDEEASQLPPQTAYFQDGVKDNIDDSVPKVAQTDADTPEMLLNEKRTRLFETISKVTSINKMVLHDIVPDEYKTQLNRFEVDGVSVKHVELYKTQIGQMNLGKIDSLQSLSAFVEENAAENEIWPEADCKEMHIALMESNSLNEIFVSRKTDLLLTMITGAIIERKRLGRPLTQFELNVNNRKNRSLYFAEEEMIAMLSTHEDHALYLRVAKEIEAKAVTVYLASVEGTQIWKPFFMIHDEFVKVTVSRATEINGNSDDIDPFKLVHQRAKNVKHLNWKQLKLQTIVDYVDAGVIDSLKEGISAITSKARDLVEFTVQFVKKSPQMARKPLTTVATELCNRSGFKQAGIRINREENSITCMWLRDE